MRDLSADLWISSLFSFLLIQLPSLICFALKFLVSGLETLDLWCLVSQLSKNSGLYVPSPFAESWKFFPGSKLGYSLGLPCFILLSQGLLTWTACYPPLKSLCLKYWYVVWPPSCSSQKGKPVHMSFLKFTLA